MNVHVLQHAPFENVGSIGGWLATRQAHVSYTRFYESAGLPDPSGLGLRQRKARLCRGDSATRIRTRQHERFVLRHCDQCLQGRWAFDESTISSNSVRYMMMVMARVPDVVIGRTRDFAQSRMLGVAMPYASGEAVCADIRFALKPLSAAVCCWY